MSGVSFHSAAEVSVSDLFAQLDREQRAAQAPCRWYGGNSGKGGAARKGGAGRGAAETSGAGELRACLRVEWLSHSVRTAPALCCRAKYQR
jgi:hypothetical protein